MENEIIFCINVNRLAYVYIIIYSSQGRVNPYTDSAPIQQLYM